MYAWSKNEEPALARYIEDNCMHLLSPLGTHPNPLMTNILSTLVPQGRSFLNSTLTQLVNVHNSKGGVYLFYDPELVITSAECTKYVGMCNLFANRIRTHTYAFNRPDTKAGQMKLYNIMRNNPNLDLH